MARSWQYPRWRRYAMQATMWVVLGATLALAAFANHERRRALRVELGPATGYGTLGVRLPRAWAVVPPTGAAAADSRVVVRAAEPSPGAAPGPQSAVATADGAGRTVTVYRERLTAAVTPLEHVLSRPEGRRLELLDAYRGRPLDPVEPIRVGEWPGVLVRAIRAPSATAAPGAPANGAGGGASAAAPRARKELYACAVLPSRHAIVIKLEGDGPPELSDAEVLKQIAAAVEVAAASQPGLGQPGETISIDGHTRVAAPERFRPVYEVDPQRTERRLWSSTDDGTAWACADLVACVLAPDDAGDVIDDGTNYGSSGRAPTAPPRAEVPSPRDANAAARDPSGGGPVASVADAAAITQAIRTIIATRDPRLRTASIEPVAAGAGRAAWRIVPQASAADEAFPTRAYLLAEAVDVDDLSPGDGATRAAVAPRRALLAVFHGDRGRGSPASFDAAWSAMAGTVDFVGPSHLPRMLAAGEAEVRRLRALGVPRLLGTSGEQWWLWFDDAAKRNIGWSNATWSVPDPANPGGATGRRQTLWRTPAGQLARATDEWWGDLRNYTSYTDAAGDDATMTAPAPSRGAGGATNVSPSPSSASPGPGEPPAAAWASGDAPKQITTLDGPRLTTEWSARDRKLGTWRRPAPPQYVPGGWLPLLVPHLSTGDGSFVLRTESFPGHEGARPPEPMLLIVTPEPAGAGSSSTTTSSGGATSTLSPSNDPTLRCIAVRVNGTGQVARWYIRPDGTPARVDLAGRLQRLPSDLKTIKFTFGHDESMVP